MSISTEKISKSSIRNSSASTVIGISLVLFMLGMLGVILLNAQKLSNYVKENIEVQVYLKEDLKTADIESFQETLEGLNYVKKVEYVSKAKAAQDLEKELGEDFVSFLGYNPLSASFNVSLKAAFATSEHIDHVATELKSHPLVSDATYSKDLIAQVNENANRIAIGLLAFSGLLLLVSIALINNTIRLAIYSKRFLIKTMQLVGAKSSFIRRPFLIKGTLHGLYAAIIAMGLISGLIYITRTELPDFFQLQDIALYSQVFGGVTLLGITIAWVSTFLAVRKYIRLRSDEVY